MWAAAPGLGQITSLLVGLLLGRAGWANPNRAATYSAAAVPVRRSPNSAAIGAVVLYSCACISHCQHLPMFFLGAYNLTCPQFILLVY